MFTISKDGTATLTKDNSCEFSVNPTVSDPEDTEKQIPYTLQEGIH